MRRIKHQSGDHLYRKSGSQVFCPFFIAQSPVLIRKKFPCPCQILKNTAILHEDLIIGSTYYWSVLVFVYYITLFYFFF